MNKFDAAIMAFLSRFTHRSWIFDKFIDGMSGSDLFKGAAMVTFLWWLWFRKEEERNKKERPLILGTFLAGFLASLVSRVLASLLPMRLRPLHNPNLLYKLPFGVMRAELESMSSFPSDHAALFFALTTGIFLISPSLGTWAALYALCFICFPRIYTGLHYPSDILAGIGLGVGVGFLVIGNKILKKWVYEPTVKLSQKYPSFFYAGFFLLSFLIATLFYDVRTMGKYILSLL